MKIEQLKLYLGTELKLMQDCSNFATKTDDRIVILDGIIDVNGLLPEQYGNKPIDWFTIMYRINKYSSGNSESPNFKPIVRPLSDYKDINGKPMQELNCDLSDQMLICDIANGRLHIDEIRHGTVMFMVENHIWLWNQEDFKTGKVLNLND